MWDEIRKITAQYDSAVLSTQDTDGYPTTIRVTPQYDDSSQTITLIVPEHSDLQSGPASLLYHAHTEAMWDLTNHLIRGTVEQNGDTWTFHPHKIMAGTSNSGLDTLKFMMRSRANAKTYLEKLNMPRPKVDWDSIKALRKRADGK